MSKRRDGRGLNPDEKELWQKVTKQVRPMADKISKEDFQAMADALRIDAAPPIRPIEPRQNTRPKAPPPKIRTASPHASTVINAGDPRTARRVRRGRVEIDATLDLHGLTQDQAFTLLAAFLARATTSQQRTLLIITGKGPPETQDVPFYKVKRGILRHRFLEWADGPFKDKISSVRQAAQHHGGGGAFYVFLKRQR